MFNILGADGKEYGPVTPEVLRQWIAERRAAGHTKVRADGTSEWKALAEWPEFAPDLTMMPPPPLPPVLSPPSRPSPIRPVRSGPRTSGVAIASLVLAILGLCTAGLGAIAGIICGIVALVKISRAPDRLSGKGLAIAGIAISTVFLLVLPAVLLPTLAKARHKATAVKCVNQVKEISLGIRLYADENDGLCPPAATWCDAIVGHLPEPESLQCPGRSSGRSDYGLNRYVAGRALSSIPPDTVMVFESSGGWNQAGGPDELILAPRHRRWIVVGFADGSVQQVSPEDVPALRWEP